MFSQNQENKFVIRAGRDSRISISNNRLTDLSGGNLVNSGGRTAGKEYWSKTAQALGVYEDEHGLRFKDRLPSWQEMKDMEAQQNMEASKKALEDADDDDDGL